MLSKWSMLLVLLVLAGAMTPLSTRALAREPSGSTLHAPPTDKARQYFTPDELARGRAYARGGRILFFIELALTLSLFALLSWPPISTRLRDLSVSIAGGRVALTILVFGFLLAILYLVVMFPLSFYGDYQREHAFGLSTQTLGSWVWEHAKEALLGTALMLPLLLLLYTLIRWNPRGWYLPAWLVAVAVMMLMAELSPVLIDPLFHTFRPVDDPMVVERVRSLTERAGMRVGPILEMDASRQTKKTNAYFTGLGRTRRVVLYDTLMSTSTPEEVELVLAHELGHWRRHHIWKGLALGTASLLAAFWVIARLLQAASGSGRFGFIHPADVVSLPLLLFSFLMLNTLTTPIQAAISRAFEREADLESLRLTNNPEAFIASEVALARTNLADIEPPKVIVWLLYTHPPVLERIAMAEAYRPQETP